MELNLKKVVVIFVTIGGALYLLTTKMAPLVFLAVIAYGVINFLRYLSHLQNQNG